MADTSDTNQLKMADQHMDDDDVSTVSAGGGGSVAMSKRGRKSEAEKQRLIQVQMEQQKNYDDKKSAVQLMGVYNVMFNQGSTDYEIAEFLVSRNYGPRKCEDFINGLNQVALDTSNEYKELTCGHFVVTKVRMCN